MIDPEADIGWRETIGNLMLVPSSVADLLDVASREERVALLGVTCAARRHLSFAEVCPACGAPRLAILKELAECAKALALTAPT